MAALVNTATQHEQRVLARCTYHTWFSHVAISSLTRNTLHPFLGAELGGGLFP